MPEHASVSLIVADRTDDSTAAFAISGPIGDKEKEASTAPGLLAAPVFDWPSELLPGIQYTQKVQVNPSGPAETTTLLIEDSVSKLVGAEPEFVAYISVEKVLPPCVRAVLGESTQVLALGAHDVVDWLPCWAEERRFVPTLVT
jgi:hypothetical protein